MNKRLAIAALMVYIFACSGVVVRLCFNYGRLSSIHILLSGKTGSQAFCPSPAPPFSLRPKNGKQSETANAPNSFLARSVLNCVSAASQGFVETCDIENAGSADSSCTFKTDSMS